MTDATERAIAEALRRWEEAPSATIIPFPTPAERMRREWMRTFTKPMPAPPTTPRPDA